MADKYIYFDDTNEAQTEREATVASTGVAEAGDVVALDAAGKLDSSLFPAGVGEDSLLVEASEALTAGDFVNIFDDAGTVKARKADAASPTTYAYGFVLAGVAAAANATVYFRGQNTQLSGLTLGDRYFLSETPGDVTGTPPTTSGAIVQELGTAISATNIAFDMRNWIIRA